MSLRKILIHPDRRLTKKCAQITSFDSNLKDLADDMFETMYDAPGIGLAAPQIGVLFQIFVMDCASKEEKPNPLVFINPVINWTSPESFTHNEGCLSIPDQTADVERPAEVEVRYLDENGANQSLVATGLLATCVQHEIDHLNGVLFIDHISRLKRDMIMRRIMKEMRQSMSRE